ncbi:MAG TPA: SGNH/GDSL hydrolase family protein [Bryobacteraceae bacterium]|nr:SGNH/GDSL hydrolase family protein [Bryobacteraceae bacterium]
MRKALSALIFLASAMLAFGADAFYLKPADTVVFYGDSITDQRLYTVLTETFVLTRYPKLNATFVHSGWGGDKVSGGGGGPIDLRLQRDVLAYHPTVMTIMLGMNDGHYQPETPENDQIFFDGYQHIVDTMLKDDAGVRITLIQPSPYDDVTRPPTFPGGYNAVLLNFSKWIANYGQQKHLAVADFNGPMVAMLQKANATDPADAQKILPDRVHPSVSGHLIMAEQLLKAWNARPLVSSVFIDASGSVPKLQFSDFAQISDLKGGNGVQWTEQDNSLPLPFAEWTSGGNGTLMNLVIHSSDVTEALNQEPLRVTGLKPGSYTLLIDGTNIGNFSSADLASGVNLALLNTPMSQQANEVYQLTIDHATIHNDRWRNIQVPLAKYSLPQAKAAMDSLDQLEAALVAKQRETAQPRAHTFQLVPTT